MRARSASYHYRSRRLERTLARGRTDDRAGRAAAVRIDCPANQRARDATDEKAGRAVGAAAVIATVIAAPVTDAVIGGLIVLSRMMMARFGSVLPSWLTISTTCRLPSPLETALTW